MITEILQWYDFIITGNIHLLMIFFLVSMSYLTIISRSTGIVVALEQIFNAQDVSDAYPHHNRFVKNMIRDTWFKRIWK